MSAARRAGWGAAAVMLAASALAVPVFPLQSAGAAPAGHHHAPSARVIARVKRQVASREQAVRQAATAVADARAHLATLGETAEVAFEAYDGAEVKLTSARTAVDRAHHVLSAANHKVNQGQQRMNAFVTTAYEQGGLQGLDTYLTTTGPADLVAKMDAANAVSNTEHNDEQRLQAASIYRGVVSHQAELVAQRASTAATAAAKAKAAAAAAVKAQTAVVTRLNQQEATLSDLLTETRSRVSRLEHERLAAIARAQARAAAAAVAARARAAQQASGSNTGPSPFNGNSGSVAGTVSSSTAAAAVQAAESQIGKPYVWAAAGPNSYDCSGLTMWAYGQVGVSLDHWTHDQWNEGAHISQSDLRPGDLVFFATNTSDPSTIHHVGMYVGNGQMVDAPYTGVDVRYDSAFRSDYIGAVRPYQR